MSEKFDLDCDTNEVANLVSYTNPPDGTHVYGIVFCGYDKMGAADDAPIGIRIIYQLIGTEAKAKESDLDAPMGSLLSENFGPNENGKKYLKARLVSLFGAEYKGGTFRPYVEQLQENLMSKAHVYMTTKIVETKGKGEKKDQTYENVRFTSFQSIDPIELPEGFEQYKYEPDLGDAE